jgi:hypothetical protein
MQQTSNLAKIASPMCIQKMHVIFIIAMCHTFYIKLSSSCVDGSELGGMAQIH